MQRDVVATRSRLRSFGLLYPRVRRGWFALRSRRSGGLWAAKSRLRAMKYFLSFVGVTTAGSSHRHAREIITHRKPPVHLRDDSRRFTPRLGHCHSRIPVELVNRSLVPPVDDFLALDGDDDVEDIARTTNQTLLDMKAEESGAGSIEEPETGGVAGTWGSQCDRTPTIHSRPSKALSEYLHWIRRSLRCPADSHFLGEPSNPSNSTFDMCLGAVRGRS